MRPLSDTPKAMLPVRGKPILEHLIVWLKKQKFTDIFLCLGHGAEEITEYFGDGARWRVRLIYQIEKNARGTAGAVRDLGEKIEEDLLVVYGDLFVEMDCGKLLDFHASHDGLATMVIRKTDHPEDSDLVNVDGENRILKIGRREGGVEGDLGCAAMWVVRKQLLSDVPADGVSDFARDIFPSVLASGKDLRAYLTDEVIVDIGTPKRYAAFCRASESE